MQSFRGASQNDAEGAAAPRNDKWQKSLISRPFHAFHDAEVTAEFRPGAKVAVVRNDAGTNQTVTAMKELLTVLATWLSLNAGLPAIQNHPQIEMVQPVRMAAIRYRGLASDRAPVTASDSDAPLAVSNIVALYDDARKTIYLPYGWRGSPAELSVLVHELVHHIQNEAGMKFACAGEREKLAYDAQAKWLAMFGMTLQEEFDIDPFTLLVRTNCLQ